MLGRRMGELLSISSSPSGGALAADATTSALPEDLAALLAARNGFSAFESALHVFHTGGKEESGSLEAWNAATGWRSDYEGLDEGLLFFAEDVFGIQFAIRDELIYTFDPETGGREVCARSIEEWAGKILDNYDELTGFPLAHQWQMENGRLPAGARLVPKIPLVLGGTFELDNLYAMDAADSMTMRASIAKQIRDLPDGTTVTFRVTDS